MRRGIGRLRAGGSGFSPAQIAFTSGLWLDQSDFSTLFQDSAGTTPVTAPAQPVGKIVDKSGRANSFTQATTTSRPIESLNGSVYSNTFDGVDDAYASAGGVTLVNGMDCFIAVKRATSANFMMLWGDTTLKYLGACSGAGTAASGGVGASATYFVNNVAVPGGTAPTEAQLNSAIAVGSWQVVEVRDMDLSTWTQIKHSAYTAYFTNGDIGGIIVTPAQSTATRNSLRTWLGAKVGLAL